MKRYFLQFAPWAALVVLGVTGTARLANTTPPPERHPRIHAAVRALREAREELRTAAHDFCGHRADALARTDEALRQLELAAECDRR